MPRGIAGGGGGGGVQEVRLNPLIFVKLRARGLFASALCVAGAVPAPTYHGKQKEEFFSTIHLADLECLLG